MAIAQNLIDILAARYGRDVRQSIHDGIAECYADVSSAETIANAAAGNANTKAGLADAAASNADVKASLANTKAGLADVAASNADVKAALANTKAGLADTAASNADTKAVLANTKAGLADTAATNANAKAVLADAAATSADAVTVVANAAASLATNKAGIADTAALNANSKAGLANTAADNADTKAGLANAAALNADAKAALTDLAAANADTKAALADTKAGLANTAALNADTKATLADTKAGLANTAALNADTKANLADAAALNADIKAGAANTAASNADTKAALADTKATLADTKAGLADTAALNADAKALLANTSAGTADVATAATNAATLNTNAKALLADTAASNADAKAILAQDGATNADAKAALAVTAAGLANTKAGLADVAATNADTKATLANTKAGLADTAATNADTKAGLADAAATSADEAAAYANAITQPYVHIKYSAIDPVANTDMIDTVEEWIGVYYGTSATPPVTYTAYTWYQFKGEPGDVTNHDHGNILNGGTIGQVAGKYLVTGTGGLIQTKDVILGGVNLLRNTHYLSELTGWSISSPDDLATIVLDEVNLTPWEGPSIQVANVVLPCDLIIAPVTMPFITGEVYTVSFWLEGITTGVSAFLSDETAVPFAISALNQGYKRQGANSYYYYELQLPVTANYQGVTHLYIRLPASTRVCRVKMEFGTVVTDWSLSLFDTHSISITEIIDFPASLPASDVSAWAKAATKPTYSYTEIGAASTSDARLSDARTPVSHPHGNITNTGLIGTTAALPIITGTGGILQTGTFGIAEGQFAQGNDARLSDARVASDVSAWAKAASKPSYTYTEVGAPSDSDVRLSDARTPVSHPHGNITNGGLIGTTPALPIITGTGGILQAGAFGTAAGQFAQGNDPRLSYTPWKTTQIGNPVSVSPVPESPLYVKVEGTYTQAGTGDPSPTNIRPILPWMGIQPNLINFATLTNGYIVTGEVFAHADHRTTDFIPVVPNVSNIISGHSGYGGHNLSFFDASQAYVSDLSSANGVKAIPSTARFVRIAFAVADLATIKFELGAVASTDSVAVKRTGKNLLSSAMESGSINSAGDPNVQANSIRTVNFVPILPNTAYIASVNSVGVGIFNRNSVYDSSFVFIQNVGYSFTAPENAYYYKLAVANSTDVNALVQLELDSIITPYEPYIGNEISLIAPQEIAAGWMDNEAQGQGTWAKYIFTGLETLIFGEVGADYLQVHTELTNVSGNGHAYSHFALTGTEFGITYPTGQCYMSILFSRLAGYDGGMSNAQKVALFNTYLAAQYSAGTPVTVYYELATPVALAPTIAPLISIPQFDRLMIPVNVLTATPATGIELTYANETPVAHPHGNLTNDGRVGSTAGLFLKTGAEGFVEASALQLGGTNLLLGTLSTYIDVVYTNQYYMTLATIYLPDVRIPVGATLTARAYLKLDAAPQVGIRLAFREENVNGNAFVYGNIIAASSEGYSSVIITLRENSTAVSIRLYPGSGSTTFSGTEQYKGLKLELGNIATDWSPAPADKADSHIGTVTDLPLMTGAGGLVVAKTMAEAIAIWKFTNPNLLHNWDFRFNPVSQRGASGEISSNSYFYDMWRNNAGPLTVVSTYLTIPVNTWLTQYIEGTSLAGKVVTVSVMIGDVIYSATETFPSSSGEVYEGVVGAGTICLGVGTGKMYFQFTPASTKNVQAVKLELGTVSTLAYDPPMEYGTELAKCMRYYQLFNSIRLNSPYSDGTNYDYYASGMWIIPMRIDPTAVIVSAGIDNIGAVDPSTVTFLYKNYLGFSLVRAVLSRATGWVTGAAVNIAGNLSADL